MSKQIHQNAAALSSADQCTASFLGPSHCWGSRYFGRLYLQRSMGGGALRGRVIKKMSAREVGDNFFFDSKLSTLTSFGLLSLRSHSSRVLMATISVTAQAQCGFVAVHTCVDTWTRDLSVSDQDMEKLALSLSRFSLYFNRDETVRRDVINVTNVFTFHFHLEKLRYLCSSIVFLECLVALLLRYLSL